MKEDPRFVCRREGHVPALLFNNMQFVEEYIANCVRCGKLVTFLPDGTERKEKIG